MFNVIYYLILVSFQLISTSVHCDGRSFTVDYENDCFLKDGQPFRYVSGSIHYFRIHPDLWADRLRKMKLGGLNAVQSYIEWSRHEPQPGVFDFSGRNNITRFILEAQKQGLLVILRPGPYICAERDMGGLPWWLLKEYPDIKLRSSDIRYLSAVDRYFDELFPILEPLLYKNGGPIISMQIENEYGSYSACDFTYTSHLRDRFVNYFGNDVVLFTTDGNGDNYLKCGMIKNVLATIDFGTGADAKKSFDILRRHRKNGPLVNSEFYSGWLDAWEDPHQTVSTIAVVVALDKILALNASVNIYMYHGGSNFAFEAGSNNFGTFKPQPTSYDYDAPISEAGDLTEKFYAIRKVIEKYFTLDRLVDVPSKEKMNFLVKVEYQGSIFDMIDSCVETEYPLSFEEVDQPYGYLLYSVQVPFHAPDPSVLSIPGLRDRAQVIIDREYAGTLSRTEKIFNLPVFVGENSTIDIFVENQGRNSYGSLINEMKGIVSNVTLSNQILKDWKICKIYNEYWPNKLKELRSDNHNRSIYNNRLPSFFVGQFILPNESNYPADTFLRLPKWTKGIAFINGYNLGRYWPVAGPQITLYAPSAIFKPFPAANEIVIFELENSPCRNTLNDSHCLIEFTPHSIINGSVPISH